MAKQTAFKLPDTIMYDEGFPYEIRANMSGTVGAFLAYGEQLIGKKLTFTPMAYRMFTGELFKTKADIEAGRDTTKKWIEFFFLYEKQPGRSVVAAVMFHDHSVSEFMNAMKPFRYEVAADGGKLDITDLTITVEFDKHQGKDGPYHIAKWSIELADPEEVNALRLYADSVNLYRVETIRQSGGEPVKLLGGSRIPDAEFFIERNLLPAPETVAEEAQAEEA